jgi:arylsulfatase A
MKNNYHRNRLSTDSMIWLLRSLPVLPALLFLTLAGPTTKSVCAREQPNIVILFADDMGYGDLACYGHPSIQNPNLDRLAREGMKFTQFYVGSSVCTPSRAALLTGRLPIRSGLTTVFIPQSEGGIPAEEITLAEVLQAEGYATACIGKWHLGSRPEYLPLNHGFDYYFGVPYSNDMSPETQPDNPLFADAPPTPLIRNFTVTNPDREPNQGLLTRQYTEEAIRFIRAHAGERPFFVYLSYTMPHVPLFASDRFSGSSRRGLYGDTIEEIDWSCGEIRSALEELGLTGNTLLVFTSDNGPWLSKGTDGGSNGPFFEGKVSTWEGGFRVPALFSWKGRIPEGVTTTAFGTTMDLFTTCVRLAGGQIPDDRPIEGQDLAPVLFHGHAGREPLMHYYFGPELWAIRKGPWKLHFKTTDPANVSVWGKWNIEEHDPPLLFQVEHDPEERFDRAGDEPAIVAELVALAQAHRDSVVPGKPQK